LEEQMILEAKTPDTLGTKERGSYFGPKLGFHVAGHEKPNSKNPF
jgi:hypothetical protein